MASLKEKIAALRKKRTAQHPLPAFPQVPNPAISSAIAPNNFKTPECELSDDDGDGELVVLPPAVPHPAAQRQLWRMNEAKRAREKVVKGVTQSYSLLMDEGAHLERSVDNLTHNGTEGFSSAGIDEEEAALETAASIEDEDSDLGSNPGEDAEPDEEEVALASTANEDAVEEVSGDSTENVERDGSVDTPPEVEPGDPVFEGGLSPGTRTVIPGSRHAAAGMIENEADEVECGGNAPDDEESRDECIHAEDDKQKEVSAQEEDSHADGDALKIATFHRKWILDRERAEVEAQKASPGRDSCSDEAITPQKTGAEVDDHPTHFGDASQDDEAAAEGTQFESEKVCHSDYVSAMFLRDDSRSRFLDEGENEEQAVDADGKTAKERREKARALWKVRQKVKSSLFQEDENSLSRFDIFEDADKSRSAQIRLQIESACRPASLPEAAKRDHRISQNDKMGVGTKRKSPWVVDSVVPEWEKRKACMQQKDKKRRRSISVGNWSYTPHGEKAKPPSRSGKPGSGSSTSASLGATCVARKTRPKVSLPRSNGLPSARSAKHPEQKKTRKSFKGLLRVLGEKAETYL